MPNFLYNYSTWNMVAIVVVFFVTLTWTGALFVRPLFRAFIRNQPGSSEIVAYLLGAHGVYFGILLGLLSVSAYGNFSATESLVADESAKLAAVYRDGSSYPEPFRTQLTDILREYTEYVINEAWPLQRLGQIPLKGQTFLDRFQDAMIRYEPKSRAQEILHAELFSQFNQLLEARRKRVLAVTSQIPDILWFIVYIGALVNVLWIWLLDMKLIPQFFLGGVTSFYLATLIALLGAMDKPFRGEMSVSSEPYQVIYEGMMKKPLSKAVVPTGEASKTEDKVPGAGGAAAPVEKKAGGATSTEAELRKVAAELKKADAEAKKAADVNNPDAVLKNPATAPPTPTAPPKSAAPAGKAAPEATKPAAEGTTEAELKKVAAELKKADAEAKKAAEVANPDAVLKGRGVEVKKP